MLASYKDTESIESSPEWSPDGKTLALVLKNQKLYLATLPADGGPVHPVPGESWEAIDDIAWLPDSRNFILTGILQGPSRTNETNQIYEVPLEGGVARRISHDLSIYAGARVSADGKMLVTHQLQYFVTLQLSARGKESEPMTLSAGNPLIGNQAYDGANGIATTPDGKIVYTSFHNQRWDIWEMGSDGSNPQRLTNTNSSTDLSLGAVSPRGDFIVFIGREGIWRMDRDGGNKKQLTHGGEWNPTISPDGKWLLFIRGEGGNAVLAKVPCGGGPITDLTNNDGRAYWPTISPDGKWIACIYVPNGAVDTGHTPMAIFPITGGKPVKVFSLPIFSHVPFAWTPDGRSVSFTYENVVSGVENVWEQPVAGGPAKPITHFTNLKIVCFAWFPDGRLVLSRSTRTNDVVLIRNFQ
jgi:Tol biopolymer transport system component